MPRKDQIHEAVRNALSKTTFEELSEMYTFALVVERFGIALLVVHIAEEEIAQWKT